MDVNVILVGYQGQQDAIKMILRACGVIGDDPPADATPVPPPRKFTAKVFDAIFGRGKTRS
jgi:hypothetical protein